MPACTSSVYRPAAPVACSCLLCPVALHFLPAACRGCSLLACAHCVPAGLAQNRYLEDPAFLEYIRYLQYWRQPQYARFIMWVADGAGVHAGPACLRNALNSPFPGVQPVWLRCKPPPGRCNLHYTQQRVV